MTLGVVLAGGRGTRLGLDVPKALATCGGRTLLARAPLERARATGERSLIVACRMLDPVIVDDEALSTLEGGEGFRWNVNTADDLARAERSLAARATP